MARRKSPYDDFPRMPPIPKMPRMPRWPRPSDDDGDDGRPMTRAEVREEMDRRDEEERERAYSESPEGMAERQKNAERINQRKYYFWNLMLTIWITRPYEMVKYAFNRLFKHPYQAIGIWHIISSVMWIVIVWVSIEIYQVWGKIPFNSDFIVMRILLIIVIFITIYLYCKLKTWWKVR